MNTKNVAIIIMLSGLENIPRITELKEIQNQYKTHLQEGSAVVRQSGAYTINLSEDTGISSTLGTSTKRGEEKVKGESLILPIKARKIEESPLGDSRRFSDRAEEDYPHEPEDSAEVIPPRPSLRREISAEPEVAEKRAAPHPRTKPHIIEEAIPQTACR